MSCPTCDEIKQNKNVLYKDKDIAIVIPELPASFGHLKIYPVDHFTIIEQVPDKLVEKMFITANKISTILFETMNAQGSNILVQNGTAAGQTENHFSIDIVARKEGDNINLQWTPLKLSDDDMATALLKLEEHSKKIGFEDEKPETVEIQEESEIISDLHEEDNYQLKQLERIP
ncbi:MAG: HIT domain-containing protein [archaeon]